VVDIRFKASLAFAEAKGDSIFLGSGDSIARMDLQER
jgi:hypothetical protein